MRSISRICVYIMVVCKLRCPSRDWIRRMSVPLASRCEANECLSACTLAALRIALMFKACLKAFCTVEGEACQRTVTFAVGQWRSVADGNAYCQLSERAAPGYLRCSASGIGA